MSNLLGQTGTQPGQPDQFSLNALGLGTDYAMQAMQNRYNQLGLGGGTANQMDIGNLPSLGGGIHGQAEATLGQMETNALNQGINPSSLNTGGKGGGLLGGLGSSLGLGK